MSGFRVTEFSLLHRAKLTDTSCLRSAGFRSAGCPPASSSFSRNRQKLHAGGGAAADPAKAGKLLTQITAVLCQPRSQQALMEAACRRGGSCRPCQAGQAADADYCGAVPAQIPAGIDGSCMQAGGQLQTLPRRASC